jgi:two-component system, LytTR family, response regulator
MTRRIQAMLVDDETLSRRGIRQLLAAHPDIEVAGECRDGRQALAALETLAPDLLFLDIQMPELDGFGVMRELIARRGADHLPMTIFLTAFEEFALDAFGVEAIDYLVKPVSEERFAVAMQRVRRRLAGDRLTTPAGAVDGLAAHRPPVVDHLIVTTARGQRVVPLEEISWIGADDYYVAIHAGGRRHLLRESMASLESRLDRSRFVRVHRAAIVHIGRVRELRTTAEDVVVVLDDGTRLPVSRRRRAALSAALGQSRRAAG